jgi:hypothetical protein
MSDTILQRAIDAAGGPDNFRNVVDISVRTLAAWKKHGVPDVRWKAVAAASQGVVSVEDLALERAGRLAPVVPAEG